jgi:DNA anti-recombination protein RmuC
MNEKERNEWY